MSKTNHQAYETCLSPLCWHLLWPQLAHGHLPHTQSMTTRLIGKTQLSRPHFLCSPFSHHFLSSWACFFFHPLLMPLILAVSCPAWFLLLTPHFESMCKAAGPRCLGRVCGKSSTCARGSSLRVDGGSGALRVWALRLLQGLLLGAQWAPGWGTHCPAPQPLISAPFPSHHGPACPTSFSGWACGYGHAH